MNIQLTYADNTTVGPTSLETTVEYITKTWDISPLEKIILNINGEEDEINDFLVGTFDEPNKLKRDYVGNVISSTLVASLHKSSGTIREKGLVECLVDDIANRLDVMIGRKELNLGIYDSFMGTVGVPASLLEIKIENSSLEFLYKMNSRLNRKGLKL